MQEKSSAKKLHGRFRIPVLIEVFIERDGKPVKVIGNMAVDISGYIP